MENDYQLDLDAVHPTLGARPASLHEKLGQIEADIHQVEFDLALLLAKRMRLVSRLGQHRAALAPQRRIPIELVREIITRAMQPAAFPLEGGVRNTRLAVSQVCSTWRRVVFATPELWQNIVVSFPYASRSSVKLANHWIVHGGACDLALTVLYSPPAPLLGNAYVMLPYQIGLAGVVCPHMHRLTYLRCVVPARSVENDVFTAPAGSFPNLEKIDIELQTEGSSSVISFGTSKAFEKSPRLRDITFSLKAHYNPLDLPFPWAQLTYLTLSGEFPPRVGLEILTRCTNLRHCSFDHIVTGNAAPEAPPGTATAPAPIVLPNLEALDVVFDENHFTSFFGHLELPNLSSLRLRRDSCNDLQFWTSQRCLVFLERVCAAGGVTDFALEEPALSADSADWDGGYPSLEPVLRCVPRARAVRFPSEYVLGEAVLRQIACGALIPRAECLSFRAFREEDRAAVVRLAEMRGAEAHRTQGLAVIQAIEMRPVYRSEPSLWVCQSNDGYVVTEERV